MGDVWKGDLRITDWKGFRKSEIVKKKNGRETGECGITNVIR